jgi:dihydroorotate dehydrogenase electron transfer subunit
MGVARKAAGKAVIYYGAKTESDFLYLEELKGLGAKLVLATEDGSAGEKGLVTTVLERDVASVDNPALYCCGPHGLLEAVAKLGISKGLPTQVSMEEYMACGIGVCGGCVTKTSSGEYVGVCKNGPVFNAKELKWD